ncbi:hypothetical protein Tco_1406523 [Tanacetum coccineum]
MPPTMTTQSTGRPVAASRGGVTGGRAGNGGGRTRGRSGDQGDSRIDGQGGQVSGQSSKMNDGVNEVPDFSTIIAQQLHNLLSTIVAQEFLACNPKEYDGKGGAIMYTHWIEKMESVQDMSGYRDSQKVKYTAVSFVGKALTWWNSQIHTRGREAAVGSIARLSFLFALAGKIATKLELTVFFYPSVEYALKVVCLLNRFAVGEDRLVDTRSHN